jgi:NADH-quinone oxidoreductase subunit F
MLKPHWILPAQRLESYKHYAEETGANAVRKARKASPEACLAEVEKAGLRGRGGGGFATGTKWGNLFKHPCRTRSVICNAAEGEPGSFKDRLLLRRNPYAVLEGMLIAAHVIGSGELYVALKQSSRKEIDRVERALDELGEAGLLEDLRVQVVKGPEEYLFGEEKALLNVIEGGGPLPREAGSPPYERGLRATAGSPNPALVNNAETFARVPGILRHGPESFRKLGTSDTPGNLLFTLSGDLEKPGVYEAEAGIPLRELFYRLGGGPKGPRTFKAALCGVSASIICPEKFETRADFGSLKMLGAGLGPGSFVLLDDEASIPRVAQAVARFLYVESCNQCAACKHGLRTASGALDELFIPKATTTDEFERVLFGARSAPQASRCHLPVGAAQVIPGLLLRFKAEFEAQASRRKASPAKWRLPVYSDYDEQKGQFVIDPKQADKNPDWTYRDPQVATARVVVGAAEPQGEAGVRLEAEVWKSLQSLAETKQISIDRQVNEALKDWLKKMRR